MSPHAQEIWDAMSAADRELWLSGDLAETIDIMASVAGVEHSAPAAPMTHALAGPAPDASQEDWERLSAAEREHLLSGGSADAAQADWDAMPAAERDRLLGNA